MTHGLTPIVASDDQTFDSYINRLSQYGHATLTVADDGSEGIITLANGSQAAIIATDLPAEGTGTYEWVRGIPIRVGIYIETRPDGSHHKHAITSGR